MKRLLALRSVTRQPGVTLELHIGAAYAEPLIERLSTWIKFEAVLWPVKGLSQGHQRQWYANHRKELAKGHHVH